MMTHDQIMAEIDAATRPPMSKEAAIDFLENLNDDIEVRISAMREELEAEGG